MNTIGSVRSREWVDLFKEASRIFSKLTLVVVCIILLFGYAFHLYFEPTKIQTRLKVESLVKEYSELLTLTESLYGLKESIRIYKSKLTAIAFTNRNRPEFLWEEKDVAERNRLKERYEKLVADYGIMISEYNSRHEAIGYCFIYPNKLPSGVTKKLPKYYVPLE